MIVHLTISKRTLHYPFHPYKVGLWVVWGVSTDSKGSGKRSFNAKGLVPDHGNILSLKPLMIVEHCFKQLRLVNIYM